MKLSFFKTAKPRGFQYRPMHYDAKKEAEEKRKREIEMNIKNPERINMRSEMERRWKRRDTTKTKSRRIMFIFYILVLLMILYFFYWK